MWSMAAAAAEAAEEEPRTSMISAPRLATRGMNSSSSQDCSTRSETFSPPTVAYVTSGNWVAEWLPHTTTFSKSVTVRSSLPASCDRARLWSRRIIAVNRSDGMSLACSLAMSVLVFAGLPTTSTRMSSAA